MAKTPGPQMQIPFCNPENLTCACLSICYALLPLPPDMEVPKITRETVSLTPHFIQLEPNVSSYNSSQLREQVLSYQESA